MTKQKESQSSCAKLNLSLKLIITQLQFRELHNQVAEKISCIDDSCVVKVKGIVLHKYWEEEMMKTPKS